MSRSWETEVEGHLHPGNKGPGPLGTGRAWRFPGGWEGTGGARPSHTHPSQGLWSSSHGAPPPSASPCPCLLPQGPQPPLTTRSHVTAEDRELERHGSPTGGKHGSSCWQTNKTFQGEPCAQELLRKPRAWPGFQPDQGPELSPSSPPPSLMAMTYMSSSPAQGGR